MWLVLCGTWKFRICPWKSGDSNTWGCIWSRYRESKREEFQALFFFFHVFYQRNMWILNTVCWGWKMLRNLFVQNFALQFECKWLALPWARKISCAWGVSLQMDYGFLPTISAAGRCHDCTGKFSEANEEFFPADTDWVCVSIYFWKVMVDNQCINWAAAHYFWKHHLFTYHQLS